jgi:hypothetical protein
MTSLAIIVSIIFLFVLLIGPITYILALIKPTPKPIIILLSTISIITGIYWITIPTPVQFLGLLPITLGILAIKHRT